MKFQIRELPNRIDVAAPGRYRIQFLVRENFSGKMGTFDAHFVVPDLTADSMLLKTSSVIWSNQREPLKAAVGAAENTPRRQRNADPLIVGDQKIVPNITKVFRRSQNMYVTFDVYDAIPDPDNQRARRIGVSMSLFNQKGQKAFEAGPIKAGVCCACRLVDLDNRPRGRSHRRPTR